MSPSHCGICNKKIKGSLYWAKEEHAWVCFDCLEELDNK